MATKYERDDILPRKICTCENCRKDMYNTDDVKLIDGEGNLFCSITCAFEYYEIHQLEEGALE